MARRPRQEPEGTDDAPQADPVAVAREIALRQLTARSRTRAELAAAMAKRGVPDEAAHEVLDRFEELRLLDDGSYARDWVSGQVRRTRSTRVLVQELKRKGVSDEHIKAALESAPSDGDLAAARAFVAKKAGSMRALEPVVRQRRLASALARRGFSSGVVWHVLKESENASDVHEDWGES